MRGGVFMSSPHFRKKNQLSLNAQFVPIIKNRIVEVENNLVNFSKEAVELEKKIFELQQEAALREIQTYTLTSKIEIGKKESEIEQLLAEKLKKQTELEYINWEIKECRNEIKRLNKMLRAIPDVIREDRGLEEHYLKMEDRKDIKEEKKEVKQPAATTHGTSPKSVSVKRIEKDEKLEQVWKEVEALKFKTKPIDKNDKTRMLQMDIEIQRTRAARVFLERVEELKESDKLDKVAQISKECHAYKLFQDYIEQVHNIVLKYKKMDSPKKTRWFDSKDEKLIETKQVPTVMPLIQKIPGIINVIVTRYENRMPFDEMDERVNILLDEIKKEKLAAQKTSLWKPELYDLITTCQAKLKEIAKPFQQQDQKQDQKQEQKLELRYPDWVIDSGQSAKLGRSQSV